MNAIIAKLKERLIGFKKLKSLLPEFCDFCLFGGLFVLWHGLYMFLPWLSYVVCGGLLMAIGLFMGRGGSST